MATDTELKAPLSLVNNDNAEGIVSISAHILHTTESALTSIVNQTPGLDNNTTTISTASKYTQMETSTHILSSFFSGRQQPELSHDFTTVGIGGSTIADTSLYDGRQKKGPSPTLIILSVGLTLQMISNGGILGILCRHKNTRRHATLVMVCTFINILLGNILISVFGSISSFTTAKNGSYILCIISKLFPKYFLYVTYLLLPMLPVERLSILLRHNYPWMGLKLIRIMTVMIYVMSFVVVVLPATPAFQRLPTQDVNDFLECSRKIKYGVSYGYIQIVITVISLTSSLIFSGLALYVTQRQLRVLGKSKRRQKILKQELIATIAVSAMIIIGSVPSSTCLFLQFLCKNGMKTAQVTCQEAEEKSCELAGTIAQETISFLLPIIFVVITPTLRLKIKYVLCRCRRGNRGEAGIMSLISSSTNNTPSVSFPPQQDQSHTYDNTVCPVKNDDAEVIISVPIEIPSSLSRVFEEYRRMGVELTGENLNKIGFDLLSMISERTEPNDSFSFQRSSPSSTKNSSIYLGSLLNSRNSSELSALSDYFQFKYDDNLKRLTQSFRVTRCVNGDAKIRRCLSSNFKSCELRS